MPLLLITCRCKAIQHGQRLIRISRRRKVGQQILGILALTVQHKRTQPGPAQQSLRSIYIDEAETNKASAVGDLAIGHASAR
jgi:hypothetical protein